MTTANGMTLKAFVEIPDVVERGWLNESIFKNMALALVVQVRGRHARGLSPCPLESDQIRLATMMGIQGYLLKCDAWMRSEVRMSVSDAFHPPEYRTETIRSPQSPKEWTVEEYKKMDLWAIGSLLYWIATGTEVLSEEIDLQQMPTRFPLSSEGRAFLASLLNANPAERPASETLLVDTNWLTKEIPSRTPPPASQAAKALYQSASAAPAMTLASGIRRPPTPPTDALEPLLPAPSVSLKDIWRPSTSS